MFYTAVNRFQIVSSDGLDPTPGPRTVQVSADGASSISFIALPMQFNDGELDTASNTGAGQLFDVIARVNGIPLFPSTVVRRDGAAPAMPGHNLSNLTPGDRLIFTHAPNVRDQTVYQVTFPAGNNSSLQSSPEVMVIRTFTTAHR
jgi:hypothetical protein